MLTNLRKRIASWLDPTPERINRELFELIVKAGRRCAHDLGHASSDIYTTSEVDKVEQSKMWHERSRMWLGIFYPDNGPKNYRAELHKDVSNLKYRIGQYREILRQHNLEHLDPDGDDIPL